MRKFLYWSQEQVAAVAGVNGVEIDSGGPASGPADEPERAAPGAPSGRANGARGAGARRQGPGRRVALEFLPRYRDRNDISRKIEMAVGRRAVWDFVSPPPTRFAKGRGTIVLSELAYDLENPPIGLAFTSTTASNGCRVAVCLFGGLANFADVVTDVTPHVTGWSASSTRVISEFVRSRCAVVDPYWGEVPALVGEILRIAVRQGEENPDIDVLTRPWRRGFTYGHVRDVGEWFAEIYCDVRTADLPGWSRHPGGPVEPEAQHRIDEVVGAYDRVIVGAPLWIRTPSLRALTLYDEISPQELDLDIGVYE